MNKVEVAKLIKHICMYYPNFKTEDVNKTIDAWLMVLHDKDLHVVLENLAEHVESNVYPPVLANLLKVPEKQTGRYIPGLEETRLMLQETFPSQEEIATEEEVKKGLAEMKKILLNSGAKIRE